MLLVMILPNSYSKKSKLRAIGGERKSEIVNNGFMIDTCSGWTEQTVYLRKITIHSLLARTGRELLK